MNFNISNLFRNQNNVSANGAQTAENTIVSGGNQADGVHSAAINLSPGSSVSGQVVSAQDGTVTIKLADSSYITAALKGNISLQQGSQVSFLVSSNSNNRIALSPLLTNLLASSPSVEHALKAAFLPINEKSTAMVTQMMEQGMGIDKKSLQTMYRAVMANPDIDSSTVVRLSGMNLAINEINAEQLKNYDNLNYQIAGSIDEITKELQEVFQNMPESDSSGAVELFKHILKLIADGESEVRTFYQQEAENVKGNAAEMSPDAERDAAEIPRNMGENAAGIPQNMEKAAAGISGNKMIQPQASRNADMSLAELVGKESFESLMKVLRDEIEHTGFIKEEQSSMEESTDVMLHNDNHADHDIHPSSIEKSLNNHVSQEKLSVLSDTTKTEIQELLNGNISPSDALKRLEKLLQDDKLSHKLLSETAIGKLVKNALENQWLLKPEDVADKEKIEHFYEQLKTQTSKLSQDVSSILGKEAALSQSTTSLSQSIDFMNQLNQIFSYVQIPLKMSGQNANGDLYVYTNKKRLADSDGNVSAFLHLDMEHLGSIDCYVTMQKQKVSTNFKVANDEVLDLLKEHMDVLNERLKKRGYSLNTAVEVKEEETSVIEEMEKQLGQGAVPVSQVSFDARA